MAVALLATIAGVIAGADGGGDGGGQASPEQPAAAGLPLRVQVGQLIVSSFDGTRLPAWLRRRLRARETAGVILFGNNVASRQALRRLDRTMQRAGHGGLLVMTDQEGGPLRGLAFAGPVAAQPDQGSAAQIGSAARSAARQLERAGVNVALAPVADLPTGATMRPRAFASPVSARVGASVRGWRRGGVAATAKHFPGLGSAGGNTDRGLVTIGLSRRALERDLSPFRAAIRARVPLVMASHALYPAYDRRRIASQSSAILTQLLRQRLGYDGVIVTDSIEAQSVVQRSSVAAAAERSVAAGADIVLTTGSASWKLIFPRLLRRARRSAAFRRRVEESAERVLALKRQLGLRAP